MHARSWAIPHFGRRCRAFEPEARAKRSDNGWGSSLIMSFCSYEHQSVRGPYRRQIAAQILLSLCRRSSRTYCRDCNGTFQTPFRQVVSDLGSCCCSSDTPVIPCAVAPRQSSSVLLNLFRMRGQRYGARFVPVHSSPLWVTSRPDFAHPAQPARPRAFEAGRFSSFTGPAQGYDFAKVGP